MVSFTNTMHHLWMKNLLKLRSSTIIDLFKEIQLGFEDGYNFMWKFI